MPARAMPGSNVKLIASAAVEIRASRRLSGRPGLEIGGMETFRGLIKIWRLGSCATVWPLSDDFLASPGTDAIVQHRVKLCRQTRNTEWTLPSCLRQIMRSDRRHHFISLRTDGAGAPEAHLPVQFGTLMIFFGLSTLQSFCARRCTCPATVLGAEADRYGRNAVICIADRGWCKSTQQSGGLSEAGFSVACQPLAQCQTCFYILD